MGMVSGKRSANKGCGEEDDAQRWFGDTDWSFGRRLNAERGQGSGFVLDGRRGTVLTNAHVVKGAERVQVTLTDGRAFKGCVAGVDDTTDLALVQIEVAPHKALPGAPLGDSAALELGDWVIAVGNPFGLENTVSLGIISNLHRSAAEVGIPEKRLRFLQTDCAINPGNSGGPLLNEFGEASLVIGITTAIRADAEGIAFAIPINYAWRVAEMLRQGQPVRHPYLGIQTATLTPDLARQCNAEGCGAPTEAAAAIPEVQGVLVVKVQPNAPAWALGVQPGDVITSAGGRRVASTDELQHLVESCSVGQALRLDMRRGRRQRLVHHVVLGDMSPLYLGDEVEQPPLVSQDRGGGSGGSSGSDGWTALWRGLGGGGGRNKGGRTGEDMHTSPGLWT
eukprot:SM000089S23843  [mRNA]  locus=s89:328788:333039:- [translate_table: standard]